MRIILGISAYFHDSAATLIVDGQVIAAAQEERFNRIKHSAVFPTKSIEYCLEEGKITLEEIDEIVFFDKPFLKFERILETYYLNAPKGLLSFLKAMPQWTQKKLFLRREIKRELKKIDPKYRKQKKILFSSHHLSHAASAYYPSPFDDAAILVIDAVGEWATATIGKGTGNRIELLQEMHFPDSVGLLYSAFTYYLGFKVNSGEYKLMGLSPYGIENDEETKRFVQIIRNQLVQIYDDGSIRLNRKNFSFEVGLKMVPDRKWKQLFGFPKRNKDEIITQSHCNLAFAIQLVTEEIVSKMALRAKELTGSTNLCLAGGVALNCVANGKLADSGIFKNIWIQPAAGDAGGALGAALALHYSESEEPSRLVSMKGAFLGPEITPKNVEDFCHKNNLKPELIEDQGELNKFVVEEIVKGKAIAWVQGKMEFGPRALGARSIIASPTIADMQRRLNLSIKFREDFRPFAPAMLKEEGLKYFNCDHDAVYMQFVKKIDPEYRLELSEAYPQMEMSEKLDFPRTKFQAISHVDFSSRLQIVDQKGHPFYELLVEMRKQTGDGIIVNTSLNTNGEPIVCDINDAYDCFIQTDIDILVVGNYVFQKATK